VRPIIQSPSAVGCRQAILSQARQLRRPPQRSGSDVMKWIAAPMVGGVTTSFLLELLICPAIFAVWKGRDVDRSGEHGL
jgi:multidrug efflux pump subunit AcrB